MAVSRVPGESSVRLHLQTGINAISGDPVYTTKTFGKVKASATDQAVYTVGEALADLQLFTLDYIARIDNNILEDI